MLAWDVATEAMAAAARSWETFPGGSRMAWVLEHGHSVLRDACQSGRVSSHERRRNRATVPKTLGQAEQRALWEQARGPLALDPDAAAVVNALERGAPSRRVLLDITLSPLTKRDGEAPERDRG